MATAPTAIQRIFTPAARNIAAAPTHMTIVAPTSGEAATGARNTIAMAAGISTPRANSLALRPIPAYQAESAMSIAMRENSEGWSENPAMAIQRREPLTGSHRKTSIEPAIAMTEMMARTMRLRQSE